MTRKKEQRAPDQDAAIEDAFVAGTLPDEDRREEADPPPADVSTNHIAEVRTPGGAGVNVLNPDL